MRYVMKLMQKKSDFFTFFRLKSVHLKLLGQNGFFFHFERKQIIFYLNLLVTRSKCVSEDSEKTKKKKHFLNKKCWKNFLCRIFLQFFHQGFFFRFLERVWNVCRSEFEGNRSKTKFFLEISCRIFIVKIVFAYQKLNLTTFWGRQGEGGFACRFSQHK